MNVMKQNQDEYKKYVEQKSPKPTYLKNCTMAFLVGGLICCIGQGLSLIHILVALISPFKVDKKMFSSKSIILLVSVISLITLGINGSINRIDGILLLGLLSIYMYSNIKSVSNQSKSNEKLELNYCGNKKSSKHENLKIGLLFILGLIMMVVGSRLLVDNGVKIADFIGIPQGIVLSLIHIFIRRTN